MISAVFGFFLFLLGSTHYYIMHYRRGEGHDFSIFAGVCYAMVPFAIVLLFKVHHSLHAKDVRYEKVKMAPLEYEDIDLLFEEYVSSSSVHLSVDSDGFLD